MSVMTRDRLPDPAAEGHALRQRAAFETWLRVHRAHAAPLVFAREPLDLRPALGRVATLVGRQRDARYLSILIEGRPGEDTPAFIGTGERPLREWTARLGGTLVGEGGYARWRTRLLFEGHVTSRFDLHLYVVGEGHVTPTDHVTPAAPDATGVDLDVVAARLRELVLGGFPLPLLTDPPRS